MRFFSETIREIWEQFVSQFVSQFGKNLAMGFVYLAIAVLFIVALFKCIMPVMKARRQLKRGTRRIRRGENKEAWQDKRFLGKGPLTVAWVEFLNSRLFADDEYHNASPIDDYINEDTAITTRASPASPTRCPAFWCRWAFWARYWASSSAWPTSTWTARTPPWTPSAC